ncbi:MAG: hypothetical protein IKR67_02360 [Lachnospiraceae bacterium]|nr:hypothetical protein [Lachnospiraceae bacterium]
MEKLSKEFIHEEMDKRLGEGYSLWAEFLKDSAPEEYRYIGADAVMEGYDGRHTIDLASACQCFFWFRFLHEQTDDKALLLGDYFFSRFSHWLIPIDSTPLIDAFSAYLKDDAQGTFNGRVFDAAELENFFRQVGIVLDD